MIYRSIAFEFWIDKAETAPFFSTSRPRVTDDFPTPRSAVASLTPFPTLSPVAPITATGTALPRSKNRVGGSDFYLRYVVLPPRGRALILHRVTCPNLLTATPNFKWSFSWRRSSIFLPIYPLFIICLYFIRFYFFPSRLSAFVPGKTGFLSDVRSIISWRTMGRLNRRGRTLFGNFNHF